MNVLMLSGDTNILRDGTEAKARMEQYASVFDALHIVVMTRTNTTFFRHFRFSRHSRFFRHFHFSRHSREGGNPVQHYIKTSQIPNPKSQIPFLHPAYGSNGITQRLHLFLLAKKILEKNHIDVISVQSPDELSVIAWVLARMHRVPLQVQIHADIYSPYYRRASYKEYIRYLLARFVIPRADCIRAVSERIKSSLVKISGIPPERIVVLPIYTDTFVFQHADKDIGVEDRFLEYDFRIITAGRFVDKEKNFCMLIDVMREFAIVCPKSVLVIVGDGRDKKKYESRIKNYGLEKQIILESWHHNDWNIFLKSFDIYVQSSNHEGWGRSVIEAMAAGLPIVMTDVGVAGEVVRDREDGLVVPVGDGNALGAAFDRLYKDKALRARMAASAQSRVRNLQPRTTEEYLAAYVACVARCKL